jgi:integrase
LHDWIVVLVNTGLRTGEATKLQWSDVFINTDKPLLHVRLGKTGPRDVVPLDAAVASLKSIRSRQQSYLTKQHKKLTQKHFVFSTRNREKTDLKQVRSFRTGFNNFLKACSFSDERRETSLAPYSLRHSYTTMRIENGTSIPVLANNWAPAGK